MTTFGFSLSSEEHPPDALVAQAQRAEQEGFDFVGISDHFHPWIDAQGHSPFVWAVIGGIAQVTERIRVGTGVTCPTTRVHPGIVAHAAATCAVMLRGRFFLGVGTGEALNEHVFGDRWPPADIRLEMLEEAVEVIRLLWEGGSRDHHGRYYTLEDARLYTLPERPPQIVVAAAGKKAASLAGRRGDGLWGVAPERSTVEAFEHAGGNGKPRYGQLSVCWAPDEATARHTVHRLWPVAALKGQLSQDLATPTHFEQASAMVTEDDVVAAVVCGPDVDRYVELVRSYEDAGFSHLYFHQIGPDQEGFLRFWEGDLRDRVT